MEITLLTRSYWSHVLAAILGSSTLESSAHRLHTMQRCVYYCCPFSFQRTPCPFLFSNHLFIRWTINIKEYMFSLLLVGSSQTFFLIRWESVYCFWLFNLTKLLIVTFTRQHLNKRLWYLILILSFSLMFLYLLQLFYLTKLYDYGIFGYFSLFLFYPFHEWFNIYRNFYWINFK